VVWAQIEEWQYAYESEERETSSRMGIPSPGIGRDLSDPVKIINRSCPCSQYMSLAQ
jgi:hypothetical protein